MSIFNLFKKKPPEAKVEVSPTYTDLQLVDKPGGQQVLLLLDPTTGSAKPFPPIDVLLRDSDSMGQTAQTLRDAGASDADLPVSREVADGVLEVLGLDTGQSFHIMSDAALQAEGLTYDLARRGAMARLRAAVPALHIEGGGGRYRVAFPDDLDMSASFILVHDEWLDPDALAGDPVFAVGTRVSIHVCGSEDHESLGGMQEIAEVMHAESLQDPAANGRPLTPTLLTYRDGKLEPFKV